MPRSPEFNEELSSAQGHLELLAGRVKHARAELEMIQDKPGDIKEAQIGQAQTLLEEAREEYDSFLEQHQDLTPIDIEEEDIAAV